MFVGRTSELEALEREYRRNTSSFVIVYGRRRTGKTTLISRFLQAHKDAIYYLATEESNAQNLRSFRNQAAEFICNPLLADSNTDWIDTFGYVADYMPEKRKIIVIDEFQYLGSFDKAFLSIMQKIWDTVLADSNIMLILCGSLISMMKSQTMNYESPLYGRRTAQINLKQLEFSYYHEFFDNKSKSELIEMYSVTGGVPKYIESFAEADNLKDAIAENVLNKQSYLYEEPFFLLQKEVSEIGSYFSLLRTIAFGNHKMSDIAGNLGLPQTGLTKYLHILSELDLVKREVPITENNPEKSKSGLYRITDNYINFWFRFVYPYMSFLERGNVKYVLDKIQAGFIQNHVAFVYEDICREDIWDIIDSVGTEATKIGRYWSRALEIDIVGADAENKPCLFGECKYSTGKKDVDVYYSLKKKAAQLNNVAADPLYVIYSINGFTPKMINLAAENDELILKS